MLDTHVLLWWLADEVDKLSADARSVLYLSQPPSPAETADPSIIVSSITALEIAQLVDRGRLTLKMDITNWLATVESIPSIRFVPVNSDIAIQSVQLPGTFHKDPADRIIVATARMYGVPLVTADRLIHAYPHVQTIW
ncbi:type II toxin-antitoxin system VapC family toxin [Acidisoma sp. 7E03]